MFWVMIMCNLVASDCDIVGYVNMRSCSVIVMFWVVILCKHADGYRCFG